jgi:Fic family protein
VSGQEPAGTYARHILNRLLIELSWNSSRLEGNTYSLLDTKRLIEFGQEAEGRDRLEAQMILNHKDAVEFLVGNAAEIGFNRYTILNLHAILANNLLADERAAGRLRHIGVCIDGSVYHPPETPQLVEECFDQMLATAAAITDPFEQSFFVMVQLPYLQPFDDVNKRVLPTSHHGRRRISKRATGQRFVTSRRPSYWVFTRATSHAIRSD